MDFVLRGGTVVDPARGLEAATDLWVSDGVIAGLGPQPRPGDWEPIDVTGLVVSPGLIDVHVHLREPGQEHKETIATGTRAAVAGGFTSVCCMPNTAPAIDRPERVRDLQRRIEQDAACRVFIIGAASLENAGEDLTDFSEMAAAGCVAMTDDAFPFQAEGQMAEVLRRCAASQVPFVAHLEDKSLSHGGVMSEGPVSRDFGLPGQDSRSEASALRAWHDAALASGPVAGAHLHIAHASSEALLQALRPIRAESSRFGRITVETAPHYFALTEDAVSEFGADAKMNPPLRGEADRLAVRAALRDGSITIIATDHAPHAPEEKARGMMQAPFGIIGLETALAVTLTEFVHTGEMSLPGVLALMTCNPAGAIGLIADGRPLGTLAVGAPADITIIDPQKRWTVDPREFQSKGRNTPFAGRELRGKAWGTIVGGEFRMRDYQVVGGNTKNRPC